ncbi:MAG: radical SAM protein [Anaerolineae bacterium]|nr:radical SAM protein [Anaerolineae bacterium]
MHASPPSDEARFLPRLIAWEITRTCNLRCAHCRADAEWQCYPDELTTSECMALLEQMAELGRPIIILTGGEPLARPDIFDITRRAVALGFPVVMGTNGTLITPETARELKAAGIRRISVSLDFPTAELHDSFRDESGAFEGALAGIRHAQEAGIEVQINTTVTKLNVHYLEDMLRLAVQIGAVAFHPFLLVPTGRGKALEELELSPEEYEQTLEWIYQRQQALQDHMFFKPTDAPHYMRVLRQHGHREIRHPHQRSDPAGSLNSLSRGCLAGIGFMFISHVGNVQGCGYLTVTAGNVRQQSLTDIWHHSELFRNLRQFDALKGKCGACEYRRICGGCRARAYEATGDYMEAEPYCVYQPRGWGTSGPTAGCNTPYL